MALGGANVWSNFSYGYRYDYPSGWLLNPERSRLILFIRNKKSAKNITMIFIVAIMQAILASHLKLNLPVKCL